MTPAREIARIFASNTSSSNEGTTTSKSEQIVDKLFNSLIQCKNAILLFTVGKIFPRA
jgi:hypothetical protein